jgi:hypothetical protein
VAQFLAEYFQADRLKIRTPRVDMGRYFLPGVCWMKRSIRGASLSSRWQIGYRMSRSADRRIGSFNFHRLHTQGAWQRDDIYQANQFA